MPQIPFPGFSELSLAEYVTSIEPLVLFVLGVVAYSMFVFKFYRFLARRDILKLKMEKYKEGFSGFIRKAFKFFVYTLENLIVIPLLVFFWFGILSLLLLILSKNSPEAIMLTSMALVAAVRVTAYYSEDLSKDLAKMIPFALLGVFLVDASYFSIGDKITAAKEFLLFWETGIYYLIFVALMEYFLRIMNGFVNLFKKEEKAEIKAPLKEVIIKKE